MTRSAASQIVRAWILATSAALLAACATMPPGAQYPRPASTALANPDVTHVGRSVDALARAHPGLSGFRLFASGSEAFTLRAQMADRAERTLDVQYFIFKDDTTGQLLMSAILNAASRGVRVRILMDDSEARGQDDRVAALAGNPNVEVRLYNPFYYRGSNSLLRYAEFALTISRLDYRMHNKLFVVDNAMGVVGGRNVGDEYFDMGAAPQFADYDVLAIGPIVRDLSKSFDEYWNSSLAIPAQALDSEKPKQLPAVKAQLTEHKEALQQSKEERAVRSGQPLAGVLAGSGGVVWAKGEVLADSPDKASVEGGDALGSLLRHHFIDAAADVKRELLMVSPYFIPGDKGEALLERLSARGVRVRVLTNSMLSTDVIAVHAAYRHYRIPLLEAGVELYEVKPLPGRPQPRGGELKEPSSGEFSLHAKAYVFDDKRVFIGSANFDRRSMHLNTEIGLMIDSSELAKQVTTRFDTIASPANSFVLALEKNASGSPHLVWKSVKDGQPIVYESEPGDEGKRELLVDLYDLLPIDSEL